MQFIIFVFALASIPLVATQYWAFPPSMFEQPCMLKCFKDLSTQDDITGKCEPDEKNTRTCMCESFKASDTQSCMSRCPQSQKDTFAAYLDGICPNVFGDSSDETPSSTADSTLDEKATMTGGAAVHEVPVLMAGFVAAWLI
ncbi:hypothetical protein V491_03572 [Pseudogymnoascus sp. VKM F-3775]|nr:hypothetical protein V491_03572 [Pseudogymnoascus sp. VKM F-3775]